MVLGRIEGRAKRGPEILVYIYMYMSQARQAPPPSVPPGGWSSPPVGCGSQWVGGAANSLMNLASHDATTYLSQPEQGQALLFQDAFSPIHCQYSRSQSTEVAMLCLDFTAQWKLHNGSWNVYAPFCLGRLMQSLVLARLCRQLVDPCCQPPETGP